MKTSTLIVRLAILALVCLVGLLGCRKPPTIIVKKRRVPVYYDTLYEEKLKHTKLPLVHEGWGPFVEILDEPVAVIAAQGKATTWEVFFATNRGLLAETAASGQERFGNDVRSVPQFGRAEIMVPFRRRGEDPQRQAEANAPSNVSPATNSVSPATNSADPFSSVRLDEVRTIAWQEFVSGVNRQVGASRQKDLLLFVHGFNVDFESALIRTAQVALDLPFNGAVVSYSWPSQGGVRNYGVDETVNFNSVEPFTAFLQQLLADVAPETRVNIVVHSMGSRLVMQSLGKLPATSRKPLSHVVFCAPDVGRSDFQRWAPGVIAQAEQVTLYASTSDSALIVSKSLHQEQRAGDSHPPLIVPGVETIDVSAVDFDFLGHSYYGSNVDVLADLFRLIKERRGQQTCAYLTRQQTDAGHYWYFSDYGDVLHWVWNFDDTIQR
ncbi:alpha/beta hydrolase [Anatilimnocola sp. NA78]|uniref:alpha/beta hydrolase n=1 Tax=Anatilimnocola sp. NA78 TaxID=3415683 RepID=UPI003CE59487